MRPFLLLLVAVTAFAADPAAKLRIYELGAPGADKLGDLPARYAAAMSMAYTAEMPNPVFRLSNLAFLPAARSERLDLYVQYARDFKVRRPGVLFIHGGGFTGGDKAEYRSASVSADLARAGYVVVSCNYVLGPKDKPGVWPRNIADCREAVRWMRANADALGLDPDRIAVAGGSAGGYLALMVGLSDDKTGPGGDHAAKHSAKVSAVIDFYGVVNFSKHGKGDVPGVAAAEQAAYLPENQCDAQDPAVLILHGTADTTVDIAQSDAMAKALRAEKVPHEYVVVQGAPHTFDLHPKGKSWKRSGLIAGAEVSSSSPEADLTEVTLAFLARTIGK
ncbi:MAG: alpha/beta hydrolase [Opitutales bacterium]|jgi:acetyl esterase/lipase|nr:alpha/beta hydrolase [Opitutales bacterium]MDP4776132.1 alpha/beta hydrolase [Opitutales bacterium]MDP4895388.1 alpha/beta hydrolase [Opitutales bacterium]